jgi:hypothetical protein
MAFNEMILVGVGEDWSFGFGAEISVARPWDEKSSILSSGFEIC